MKATSPQLAPAGSNHHYGLPNPDKLLMPPPMSNDGGDNTYDDVRPNASKVKVQMQSGVSPSALVKTSPTIASAELEGQQSSGFHPSVLAS